MNNIETEKTVYEKLNEVDGAFVFLIEPEIKEVFPTIVFRFVSQNFTNSLANEPVNEEDNVVVNVYTEEPEQAYDFITPISNKMKELNFRMVGLSRVYENNDYFHLAIDFEL